MQTIENSHHPSDTRLSHPISNSNAAESSAEKLKALLLSLSKDPQNAAYKSILRSAADSVREKAFGYNRSSTKKKILKLLSEFECLELVDLTDETGIAETEIKAALNDLIIEGNVVRGKRRRWQEPGKHFNELYSLAGNTATIG